MNESCIGFALFGVLLGKARSNHPLMKEKGQVMQRIKTNFEERGGLSNKLDACLPA